jgi:hypothetical protein
VGDPELEQLLRRSRQLLQA